MRSHGLESSKSTPSSRKIADSAPDLMDGPQLVTQEIRDHTTAPLVVTFATVEPLLTHTTNAACTLESPSPEPTVRLCQDNGSIRSDHVLELIKEITSGPVDSFSIDVLKSTICPSPLSQSSSQTGTVVDATPTSPPKP